jgi:replicative DNA helicase
MMPEQDIPIEPADPNALQTEYALLGWIATNNDILNHLDFLQPEHFYSPQHGRIFDTMRWMRREGLAISPYTIEPYIEFEGNIVKYLTGSLSASMAMVDPIFESGTIIEMANRREILNLCKEQIDIARHTSRPCADTIAALIAKFEKIQSRGDTSKFQTNKQVSRTILSRMNNPHKPHSTGIAKLDIAMEGGLFPGMNYLLCGRKKMGKTSLAGTISANLNSSGVKHLFICAEMTAPEIMQRLLARITSNYTSSFRNDNRKNPEFQQSIQNHIDNGNECIYFLPWPGIPFEQLKSSVAQAISLYGIKGFILDSLQLVGGKPPRSSLTEHFDTVSQWVADYGRQRGIFTIETAQINQSGITRFGEGALLACDQAYEVRAPEDDPSRSDRWLEMMETRYTPWMNIGSKETPALLMHEYGQYFYEPDNTAEQPPLAF